MFGKTAKQLTFRLSVGLLGCCVWSGCAETLDTTKKFTIYMQGSLEAPADATGDADPDAITFTLEDITLSPLTAEAIDLYDVDAADFKIIKRDQIIFQKAVTDLDGTSYGSATITFNPTAVVKSELDDAQNITLTSPVITSGDFVCGTGQDCALRITVLWKNTITRDADAGTDVASQPSFQIEAL